MGIEKYGAVLIGICLLFLFFSCAGGPSTVTNASGPSTKGEEGRPAWVDNPEIKYPEEEYMAARGVGDSLNEAKAQAANALSQTFQVRVESTFETTEQYKEIIESDKKLYSTEVETREEIMLESEQELINIQYGESYTADDGRVYTIAYLDRDKTATIYESKINELFKKVLYFTSEAEKADSLAVSYAYQRKAVFTDRTIATLMGQLSIINNPRYKLLRVRFPYDQEQLYSTFDKLSNRMTFSVTVQNDKEGKIAGVIKQLLSENNFKIDDNGIYSINAAVRFEEMPADKEDYYIIKWYVTVEVMDQEGRTVVAIDEDKRETAVSRSAALSFAYKNIEKMLETKFMMSSLRFLDDMVSMSASLK